jgi:hypothetical protein
MQISKSSALFLFGAASLCVLAACQKNEARAPSASAEKSAPVAPEFSTCNDCISVTADNFNRAESDIYFGETIRLAGGIGKFDHRREIMAIDKQTVIRANRDTLYSAGVFDLDAGPVTITLPDAGKRFMSMLIIDEDQFAHGTYYGIHPITLTKEQIGTRYVMVGVRTFVDPNNPQDLENAHALQDGVKASQKGPGTWDAPKWDPVSQKKVRDALVVLASTIPDTDRTFGNKNEVDPVRHLIGSATGWGGNAKRDALYITIVPSKNDGTIVYKLHVDKDVPVDGFWSISLYGSDGYFKKNPYDAYSLNNITATKQAEGAVDIQFGGCDGKIPNCLPITPGWNYWVRLYRPRPEVLSGKWKFPEAQPVP